jgi:hypothetical protein
MYTLRLTMRDEDDGRTPFKHAPISTTADDQAIEAGRAQIAEHMPAGYAFVQARVCRDEEVIWSSNG